MVSFALGRRGFASAVSTKATTYMCRRRPEPERQVAIRTYSQPESTGREALPSGTIGFVCALTCGWVKEHLSSVEY